MQKFTFTPRSGDSAIAYASESSVRFTPSGWNTPVLAFEQGHDNALALRIDLDTPTTQQAALLVFHAANIYARFGVDYAGDMARDLAYMLATNGRGVLWSTAGPE